MGMITISTLAVGLGIYAATRTIKMPGQKLGDISVQTAKEGEPRLIVWGIVRPIGGNIVAVQEPPRIEKRKQKSGGKGGGGSSYTSEHPHRTYAVAVCEGPITGFRRIWRNNKLVYDGRHGSEWGRKNNSVFLKKARFYLGGFKQMPSPDLEAVFGVGQVPAMRGTAYMVMVDEDLSDMGGAVPQWLFEVFRSEGVAITSRPYAVDVTEKAGAEGLGVRRGPGIALRAPADSSESEPAIVMGGSYRRVLMDYTATEEATRPNELLMSGGRFSKFLVELGDQSDSSFSTPKVSGGVLSRVVAYYNNYPPESSGVDESIISGGYFVTNVEILLPPFNVVLVFDSGDISISWSNDSNVHVSQRIYRSTAPFNESNLPPVYAEISKLDRSYVDADVDLGKNYYYAVSTVPASGPELISEVKSVSTDKDPHWDDVVSLLHFDGNIYCQKGVAWQQSGSGVTTPQEAAVFGSGGARGRQGGSIQTASLFGSHSGDFTIEFWLRPRLFGSGATIFDMRSQGGRGILMTRPAANPDGIAAYAGPSTGSTYSVALVSQDKLLSHGVPVHVAFVRSGSDFYLFANGELVEQGFSDDSIYMAHSASFLNNLGNSLNVWVDGDADELRVSKIARYTEPFDPPQGPFPSI